MVCLDTTFLADLFRKNPDAERKLAEFVRLKTEVSTTIVNVAELYYGAYKSKRVEEERRKVKRAVERFSVLELSFRGAETFGAIMVALERSGQKVHDRDVLVAAIALSSGESVIVTRNVKDFTGIPGLTVVSY
jgi:predicted nucleic acid-binding protein